VAVRIAERWFEIARVDAATTLLREPHLHPVWQSNIWHVRGRDRDLLVDAGMGIGRLAEALADLVDKPLVAVATHRHADHIGGLHELSVRLAHPADAEEIAAPSGFASLITADYPDEFVTFIASGGSPVGPELVDAYPWEGFDPRQYRVRPAPPTQLVEEGDVIDLGDRTFQVVHLPGHTPGSIGLWDPRTSVLFSGDAIYDGPLYDFLPESNIADYIATMHRLRDLPVTVVHGGHDGSFGRARLLELVDGYLGWRAPKAV
jgi:glyoxylase-like metal-dependent hydrolase (beta-lactamase superfamily II)